MRKDIKDIKDMNSIESLAFMEMLKEAKTKVIIATDVNNEKDCCVVQGSQTQVMSAIITLLRKLYEDKAIGKEYVEVIPKLITGNLDELTEMALQKIKKAIEKM